MGLIGSPEIFQENTSTLMKTLEFVRVYIDNLLTITKSTYKDHMSKLRQVLVQLKNANLRVNANKSSFAQEEVGYLEYLLTRQGIKPVPEKIFKILYFFLSKGALVSINP